MEHMHHEALDTDLNKLEQAVRSLHDWVVNLSNSLATQGHELSMLRSTVEGLHTNVGDFRRSGQRIVIDSCDLEVRDANLYVHTGTGSHPGKNGKGNLVVGKSHDVSMARNGLVSGTSNTIRGQAPTVLGGATNIADGDYSVVIGGKRNHAKGTLSLVNGGAGNSAEGTCSCVFGGQKSVARERHAVEIGSDQRLDRAPSSVTSIGGRSVTSIGELHSRDLESWAASSPCSPCSPRASLPENEVTHGEVSGSTKASPLRASLQEDFAATGRVSASSQPEAEMPVTKRSGPGPAPGDVERRGNETRNSGQHALHWQVLLLTALAIILALNWVHLFKVSTESADLSVEHLQTHMLECNVTEAIREATLSELQKHRFATHGDLEATREATLAEVRKYRFAKQSDLEAMREVTMSEVHKHRAATEERVGQKISDLEATTAATLSEVHKQRAITEERIDQNISDLEVIRDATLSEVLKQRVAAEEYIDKKIFELCTPPSIFKARGGQATLIESITSDHNAETHLVTKESVQPQSAELVVGELTEQVLASTAHTGSLAVSEEGSLDLLTQPQAADATPTLTAPAKCIEDSSSTLQFGAGTRSTEPPIDERVVSNVGIPESAAPANHSEDSPSILQSGAGTGSTNPPIDEQVVFNIEVPESTASSPEGVFRPQAADTTFDQSATQTAEFQHSAGFGSAVAGNSVEFAIQHQPARAIVHDLAIQEDQLVREDVPLSSDDFLDSPTPPVAPDAANSDDAASSKQTKEAQASAEIGSTLSTADEHTVLDSAVPASMGNAPELVSRPEDADEFVDESTRATAAAQSAVEDGAQPGSAIPARDKDRSANSVVKCILFGIVGMAVIILLSRSYLAGPKLEDATNDQRFEQTQVSDSQEQSL